MPKFRLCALAAGVLLCHAAHAENVTPQLKINGFATAAASFLSNDSGGAKYMENSYGRAGIGEDVNTDFDSLLGLQLDYQANDKTNMVVQLEAMGQKQYSVEASWAYIRYQLSDEWAARAGRVSFPGFMYSDTMDVGNAYPWVRTPPEVYSSTPVKSLEGVEALWHHGIGAWTAGAQLTLASGHATDNSFTLQNVGSVALTLTNNDLLLRICRLQGQLNSHFNKTLSSNAAANAALNAALDFHDADASFTSAGFTYDDNNWMAQGEIVAQRVDGWAADFNAGYVTAGHYFGHWLPFLSWQQIHTVNLKDKDVPVPAISPTFTLPTEAFSVFDQSSISAGLRVDPRPNLSVKFQVDHIYDFHGSGGLFRFPTPGVHVPSPTNLYSVAVSTSF